MKTTGTPAGKAPSVNFQAVRGTKRESRSLVGRFRGGKLNPVMAVAVRGNDGGMLSQNITLELDPIAGRLITPITGEFISVFAPVQAIDAIRDPLAAYAGMTEVVREKLLSGNPLFGLEGQTEISKRCGVNPRAVNGAKRVSTAVRLGHNAAVNYLRQRKYHKATQLLGSNNLVTPAILMQTVLDRMNGVLDPDDRINGSVELQLPTMNLPVSGIGFANSAGTAAAASTVIRQTDLVGNDTAQTNEWLGLNANSYARSDNPASPSTAKPDVFAILNGTTAGNVSLSDFYNAEKMDQMVRVMQQIVEDNPEYGEEMILRWAHGLNIDSGKTPFVIAEKSAVFGRQIVGATDSAGVAADTIRSDMAVSLSFSVPIPKTELGGIIFTFAVIRPDETFSDQPHPFLSDVWGLDNFVADELALDPVPVLMRDLDSNITEANETTVAFYTGVNQLKATYVDYGLCAELDPTTVSNKTSLWQIKVPASVTPDNILYPTTLDHYPFADALAEVCTYTIVSQAVMPTPMIVGPTPVETLSVIDSETIFS